jgi:hypothetical protein
MSEHTPGPWKIVPTAAGLVIETVGQRVALVHGSPGPLSTANARLISAAPELLDIAEALSLWFNEFDDYDEKTVGPEQAKAVRSSLCVILASAIRKATEGR